MKKEFGEQIETANLAKESNHNNNHIAFKVVDSYNNYTQALVILCVSALLNQNTMQPNPFLARQSPGHHCSSKSCSHDPHDSVQFQNISPTKLFFVNRGRLSDVLERTRRRMA